MKRTSFLALILALALCLIAIPATAAHSPEKLLRSIESLAEEGGILNCDFQVKSSTIDEIIDELGSPNRSNYVKSAHGTYATFSSDNVVVGYGKGDQVFELRSYSKRLHVITERNVTTYFGEPDHTSSLDGQRIISYVLNDEFNVKFVFDTKNADAPLNHYNVIWLEGTENDMAGDHGRNW
ncbi:YjgB family protein [Eubacteriales bacterium OttesenSCG-928-N13]|nr:YjgB family protein [Eubacteriales bacterium OttesenSCG-928-N13]